MTAMRQHARRLSVLALLLAPACLLTQRLWDDTTAPRPKVLQLTSTPCAATAVRTRLRADGCTETVVVQFTAAPGADAPAHISRFAARPGWLELRPPAGDGDWRTLPGAERFAPSSWDLRVTNGDYFRRRVANARLLFHGEVAPTVLGRLVAPESLPPELRAGAAPLEPAGTELDDEGVCLRAFATHAWPELLAGEPATSCRAEALAWLGPDGMPLAAPPVAILEPDRTYRPARPDAAECSLLGRVTAAFGDPRFVVVPVPVLLQGRDLALVRDGDCVRWTRRQVWDAAFVEVADARELAEFLPLRSRTFAYRFGREVEPSRIGDYAMAVALTPIVAALDLVISTNPSLLALYRYLFEPERLDEPRAPGGR